LRDKIKFIALNYRALKQNVSRDKIQCGMSSMGHGTAQLGTILSQKKSIAVELTSLIVAENFCGINLNNFLAFPYAIYGERVRFRVISNDW